MDTNKYRRLTKAEKRRTIVSTIRRLYASRKKIPSSTEIPWLTARAERAFGTWDKAIRAALGKNSLGHRRNRLEIIEILRHGEKHGKLRYLDYSSGVQLRARKLFGSWEKAWKAATGKSRPRHSWTEREIVAVATRFMRKHRCLPRWDQLGKMRGAVRMKYGSMGEFAKAVLGEALEERILQSMHRGRFYTAEELGRQFNFPPRRTAAFLRNLQRERRITSIPTRPKKWRIK